MKWNDVFCNTFKALSEELGLPPADKSLVELCRADDADFCQEVVAKGWLSEAQMAHAAERYRLGKSKNGKPIFWMIDERGIVRDGRIGDTWVSMIFKRRYPECGRYIVAKHCLFGMQLRSATLGTDPSVQPKVADICATLGTDPSVQPEVADICVSPYCCTVAIVESERSAVVLSELFPECIWMAYSYPSNFTVDKLAPLQGCVVSIYPHTDPTGCTYVSFLELADQARRLYDIDLSVVSLLEEHASEEQKERCIDILDFITESSP